jgi:hypothetical protein
MRARRSAYVVGLDGKRQASRKGARNGNRPTA